MPDRCRNSKPEQLWLVPSSKARKINILSENGYTSSSLYAIGETFLPPYIKHIILKIDFEECV